MVSSGWKGREKGKKKKKKVVFLGEERFGGRGGLKKIEWEY